MWGTNHSSICPIKTADTFKSCYRCWRDLKILLTHLYFKIHIKVVTGPYLTCAVKETIISQVWSLKVFPSLFQVSSAILTPRTGRNEGVLLLSVPFKTVRLVSPSMH